MMKWTLKLILVSALSSFSLEAKEINIVTEHLAPFQIVESNKVTGLSTELIHATMKQAAIDYSIQAHPWSLAYNRALQEKNTCIYSIARIPPREDKFHWIGRLVKSTTSFYSLARNPIAMDNLQQAKKYRIAVIKDDVVHHFLLNKGFKEGEQLYVLNNYDALLSMLELPSRQIDLIVINNDLIRHRVKNSTLSQKYYHALLLSELTLDFHFACNLATELNIVEKLTTVMSKLNNDGTYQAIIKKWQKELTNLIQ